jgi:hypothetical protein
MKTDFRIKFVLLAITMAFPVVLDAQVVINEFLARNNTDTVNEYGNHEDWIELINLTGQPADLSNPDPDDFNFVIAPNPAKDHITISTDIKDGYYFEIFSLTGTIVLSRLISNSVEYLDVRKITPGLFFYLAKGKYGRLSSGKILKL